MILLILLWELRGLIWLLLWWWGDDDGGDDGSDGRTRTYWIEQVFDYMMFA